MSEKVVVRYTEDVCCPHCIKLFPLADGLVRSPMIVGPENQTGFSSEPVQCRGLGQGVIES